MKKENQKTHRDVMRSVAIFISNLSFEGEFKKQPTDLQEMFELLLNTEFGNDLVFKTKNACLSQNKQRFGQRFISVYR